MDTRGDYPASRSRHEETGTGGTPSQFSKEKNRKIHLFRLEIMEIRDILKKSATPEDGTPIIAVWGGGDICGPSGEWFCAKISCGNGVLLF
ncbi:hypothetical protein [uncultured Victivallis sp.]|uniref:hypothetical protein n=1 Tax=uncultured Victivallis sp. TaxID=354118 RepID=UPI002600F804|nr:hypothetical protein [uncultured Victivallis sp.]